MSTVGDITLELLFLAAPAARIGAGAAKAGKSIASFGGIRRVLSSAQEAYNGGAVVGHALSKHSGKHPKIWGTMTGSTFRWNDQGMKHSRDIARGPGSFEAVTNAKSTNFLEKMLPNGRGVRLNMDGTFKGFIQ